MKDANTKPIVSRRLKRVTTFVTYVAAMNQKLDAPNDVLLMTDFAEIRFTPSFDQDSNFFAESVRAIEDGIADDLKDKDADVLIDGAFIVIPEATVKPYGSNTVIRVPGMVLFVDTVKGMTMGNY